MDGSLVVLGSLNMDLVMRLPRLPRPGTTTLGGTFGAFPGGKGANQAVAAARMGGRVHMIGCVGDDDWGAELRQVLHDDGVNVQHLRTVAGTHTAVGLIAIDEPTGENMIGVASGANGHLSRDMVEEVSPTLRRASMLLLQLEIPMETNVAAARVARDAGARIMLNAAPAMPVPEALMRLVDVLVVNEHEAVELAGGSGGGHDVQFTETSPHGADDHHRAAAAMAGRGIPVVVVTLGAHGCLVLDRTGARQLRPFPVKPVDTVGAGDAFVGALAVELVSGTPLDRAARRANAAGALATTVRGAIPSLPRSGDVDRLLGEVEGGRRAHEVGA